MPNKSLKYVNVDDGQIIPFYKRPEVVDTLQKLWAQEQYGRVPQEGSFVVHGRKADGTPIILPIKDNHEYKKETFSIGPGDQEIYHSHPALAGTDPMPSVADRDIADKHPGMGMYTMSKDGVYRYAKGMKAPELVQKGTDFSQYDEELPAPSRPDISRIPIRQGQPTDIAAYLGSALPPEEPVETAQGVPKITLAKK